MNAQINTQDRLLQVILAPQITGKRQDWKKAYVSLKPGQEINFAAGE